MIKHFRLRIAPDHAIYLVFFWVFFFRSVSNFVICCAFVKFIRFISYFFGFMLYLVYFARLSVKRRGGVIVRALDSGSCEPGSLLCVLWQNTLLSQCLSPLLRINGYRRIQFEGIALQWARNTPSCFKKRNNSGFTNLSAKAFNYMISHIFISFFYSRDLIGNKLETITAEGYSPAFQDLPKLKCL